MTAPHPARPTNAPRPKPEPLLSAGEVAELFRVDPKTVRRWAEAGKISSIRTLGGHRRFLEREIRQLIGESTEVRQA